MNLKSDLKDEKMNNALSTENKILRKELQSLTQANQKLLEDQILFGQAEKLGNLGH